MKFSNIKLNEGTALFFFDILKPFYNGIGIFPLVNVQQLIKCWFIFSKIDLLILQSSLLEGFIKRQGKLD